MNSESKNCVVCGRDALMELTSISCACGHFVCKTCFLHDPDEVEKIMKKLHAPKRVKT
jgi:hypothetical protein